MELPKKKTSEADAYSQAGDEAAKQGRHDSAEMFYDMAAGERIEAEHERRNEGRKARKG